MSCPSCGGELRFGQDRCPVCGSQAALPVEGALAPKPAPLRELPGTRKKEKTWRDEVNERVRSRRKKRESETGLPLFDGIADPEPEPSDTREGNEAGKSEGPIAPRLEDARFADSIEEPVGDLPLRVREEAAPPAPAETHEGPRTLGGGASPVTRPFRGATVTAPSPERRMDLDEEPPPAADDEWRLELQPSVTESRPVERPAVFAERLRAGAVDFLLWGSLSALVTYFAGRAARVPVLGLRPAWPWLAAYLAFLGLAYATYFTGTTGQTLGKMMLGLRVVDTAGQPPGYLRAFLRAALGSLGVMAAGLGLVPMAFDPALRALHDRACRTRVIRN